MSIQQNMQFESGLLRVDISGEFSLEDAKQAFLEMLAAVVQHQAEKILLDGRNVTGNPRDMERFYYANSQRRKPAEFTLSTKLCRDLRMFSWSLFETQQDMGKRLP